MEKARPTLEEVPVDRLKEVMEAGHTEAVCYLRTFNIKGQINSLPSQSFSISDLLTDTVEVYLRNNYGGGSYIVEPRNVANHAEELCPRYRIVIVGPPKAQLAAAALGGPTSPQPQPHNEIYSGLRSFGYPPQPGSGQQNFRPGDFMSYTPDAIALQQVNALREELKNERRTAKERDQRHQQQLEAAREQVEAMRAENARVQAETRESLLKAELAAIRERINVPPSKPAFDPTAIAAFVGALVPVFTTMISTSRDRQQLQMDAQKHASDQQMNMLMSILKKPDDGGLKLIVELLPKLLNNNPAQLHELMATMSENSMQMLSLSAQAIGQLMPEAESPGLQMIREVIGGLQGMAERAQDLAQSQRQEAKTLAAQGSAVNGHAKEHLAEVVNPGAQPRRKRPTANQAQPQPQSAQDVAKQIMALDGWPDTLRDRRWLTILTALHSNAEPEAIGTEIMQTLEELAKARRVPSDLLRIFDEGGPEPSALLRPIFTSLPIGTYPDRLTAILRAMDAELIDVPESESDAEVDEVPDAVESPSADASGGMPPSDLS